MLYTIAAFRMPATWETLRALLVEGIGNNDFQVIPPCANESDLDAALTDLEDRGLVGWDKQSNRYDLHPIARGVVWHTLSADARHDIFEMMHSYFEALPKVEWKHVKRLEELEPYFQLSQSLIGLGRSAEAEQLLQEEVRRLVTPNEERIK